MDLKIFFKALFPCNKGKSETESFKNLTKKWYPFEEFIEDNGHSSPVMSLSLFWIGFYAVRKIMMMSEYDEIIVWAIWYQTRRRGRKEIVKKWKWLSIYGAGCWSRQVQIVSNLHGHAMCETCPMDSSGVFIENVDWQMEKGIFIPGRRRSQASDKRVVDYISCLFDFVLTETLKMGWLNSDSKSISLRLPYFVLAKYFVRVHLWEKNVVAFLLNDLR